MAMEKEGKELGILTLDSVGSWRLEFSSSLREEGRREAQPGPALGQGPHFPEFPQLLSLSTGTSRISAPGITGFYGKARGTAEPGIVEESINSGTGILGDHCSGHYWELDWMILVGSYGYLRIFYGSVIIVPFPTVQKNLTGT